MNTLEKSKKNPDLTPVTLGSVFSTQRFCHLVDFRCSRLPDDDDDDLPVQEVYNTKKTMGNQKRVEFASLESVYGLSLNKAPFAV